MYLDMIHSGATETRHDSPLFLSCCLYCFLISHFLSGYKIYMLEITQEQSFPTVSVVKGSFKLSEQSITHRALLSILIPHSENEKP